MAKSITNSSPNTSVTIRESMPPATDVSDARNHESTAILIDSVRQQFIPDLLSMAVSYPHPHSVLGRPNSHAYIEDLQRTPRASISFGWLGAFKDNRLLSAAHVSQYGKGDGTHTLWKVRHLLMAEGAKTGARILLRRLPFFVSKRIDGSLKLVAFFSEHEREEVAAAKEAGWRREGIFRDYYRLGERCFVMGTTYVPLSEGRKCKYDA